MTKIKLHDRKKTDGRLMVDISTLQEEIAAAIMEDQINNGYVVGVKFTNYIREEIIAPWLNFRLELKKIGYTAPMLADLLAAIANAGDMHKLVSTAKEIQAQSIAVPHTEECLESSALES